jgi:lamin tail-like protein
VDRNACLNAHADLKKIAPTLSDLVHSPAEPGPRDTVWVNVKVSGTTPTTVMLYHRIQGPYIETPMFDDGNHNDGGPGDRVYGASIPPGNPLDRVEYYTSASGNLSQNGAMAFEPAKAEFTPREYRVGSQPTPGPILISEFVAKNDSGIRDENNECEDWIELTNAGNQPLSVSGMYLTDTITNPTRWKIPAGYTLQPGKTLLVWADDEVAQGSLHAMFIYFPITTNTSGSTSFPITVPNASVLVGATFYFQAFVQNGVMGGFSNAVATRIGP